MQEAQDATRGPAAAPELGRGPETHHTREGDETVLNASRARQGVSGHHVRYVLGFGLAGIVVAFIVAYLAVSGAFG